MMARTILHGRPSERPGLGWILSIVPCGYPFSLTVSIRLKSKTKHSPGVRVPFIPSAHEKPVFVLVVGSLSLGLCRVVEINYRNCGNQNTHYD